MNRDIMKKTSNKQIGPYRSVRHFLIDGLPDFCWQTSHEIMTYAEQLDEDVNSMSLIIQLWRLGREGWIERKLHPTKRRGPRGRVWRYKRRAA